MKPNSSTMIVAFLAVCLIALSEISGDPCVGYETIRDPKRSSRYTAKPDEPNISDDSSSIDDSTWYRFIVLAPSRMHDRCVNESKCGTEQPIWLNGSHPTADDPGPKEVQVCSPSGDDCCGGWESTVWLKFCRAVDDGDEDFYVYNLTPTPEGDMAYCAGDALVCERGEIYNPNSDTCTDITPKIRTPIFEGPIIINKTLKGKVYRDFKFVCNVRVERDPDAEKKGQRVEVVFTFDGQHVPDCVTLKTINGTNDRGVELWSNGLKGHCLDKKVSCMVRSFWKNLEKRKSDFLMARDDYFVGLRYSLTNPPRNFSEPPITITVTEGDPPLTVYFESTIPISCPDIQRGTSCKITVPIDDIPEKDRIAVGSCSVVFNGFEPTGKPSKLKVQALLTAGLHHRTSVIRFKPVQTSRKFFWNNYQPPDIEIKVSDSTTQMSCSSYGDPRITKFDGRQFFDMTVGDYILTKSANSTFEVHVRQCACWGVSCNCGVAVREGNDVLGITVSSDRTVTPIAFSIGKSRGAIMTNSGNTYTILMPSGAYVLVDNYYYGYYLNIYVYGNSKNIQGSTGLCGAEGNYKRLKDEDSLLNAHLYGIKCLDKEDTVESVCSCRGTRPVACKPPKVDQNQITKTTVTKYTRKCLTANSKRRKKRDVDDNEVIDDDEDDEDSEDSEDDQGDEMVITADDFPIPKVDENYGVNLTLKWPTPSGVTEAEARRRCRSKLESSPVFNLCKSHVNNSDGIINDCVSDLQIIDDTEVATSYVTDSFQKQCVTVLENAVVSNTTNDANETVSDEPSDGERLLFSITSEICPNQCNGNGTCVNGTCRCNSGFAGDDCSKNTRNPPDLTAIRKGSLCDSRTSVCTVAFIYAKNFYRSKDLLCKVTEVNKDREFNYSGSMVSEQMLSCKLPMVHRFSNKSRLTAKETVELEPAPFYRWEIAVSNDAGEIYSKSLPLTVFDSKCRNCDNDGNCTRKNNTCEIKGRCYSAEEVSDHDPNLGCIPSKSQENWSTRDPNLGSTPAKSQENLSTRDSNLGSTPAKSQENRSARDSNLGSTSAKSQENLSTRDSNLGSTSAKSQENWSTRDSNLGSPPAKSPENLSTRDSNLGSTSAKSQENWSTRDSNLGSTPAKSQENLSTRDSNLGSPPAKSQENLSTRDSNLESPPAKSQAKSSTRDSNLGSTPAKSQENLSTRDSNLGSTSAKSQENWSTRDSNLGSTLSKSPENLSTRDSNLGPTPAKSHVNWSTRDSNLGSPPAKSQSKSSTRDSNLGSTPAKSQAKSLACGAGYWCGNASRMITGDMTIAALALIVSTIYSLY